MIMMASVDAAGVDWGIGETMDGGRDGGGVVSDTKLLVEEYLLRNRMELMDSTNFEYILECLVQCSR